MASFSKLKKVWDHLHRDLPLITEAILALVLIRFRLLFFPKRVLEELNALTSPLDSPALGIESHRTPARRICRAVERIAKFIPLGSRCLCVALATHRLLLRRGIRCSVRIGVRNEGRGGIAAHAWIEGFEPTAGASFTETGEFHALGRFPKSEGELR